MGVGFVLLLFWDCGGGGVFLGVCGGFFLCCCCDRIWFFLIDCMLVECCFLVFGLFGRVKSCLNLVFLVLRAILCWFCCLGCLWLESCGGGFFGVLEWGGNFVECWRVLLVVFFF